MTVVMSNEVYEQMRKWAWAGADLADADTKRAFWKMSRDIDLANGIKRYTLMVRYIALPEKPGQGLAGGPVFTFMSLELARPPIKEDILNLLAGKRYDENNVHVTADLFGKLGWYELEKFPWGV